MKKILNPHTFCAAALFAAAMLLCSNTAFAQSGEVLQGNSTIGPVFDSATGNTVYVRQTLGAPMPVNSSVNSMVPVYVVVYPLQSTIPADSLQCLPTNCDHLNVLPFPDPDYGLASGDVCQKWNAGAPCSLVKGHVHLFGFASDGGDFKVPHFVKLVIFTSKAFGECTTNADCAINTMVSTQAEIQALVASGDVVVLDTPITVNLSVVPERTYELGTPTVIAFP
ncbi:MAG TPA: hypothetical protein VFU55_05005 [Terracidiphilus sp.]|nr:hypothetical protein [Terracidiphilus sp.]